MLSVTDIRPGPRGESIAGVDLRLATEHWAGGIETQLGAAWFDFQQLFGPSGNIKDQSWALRPSLDRLMGLGGATKCFVGLGMEYGEWRSWTDTRLYSSRGPHAFFTGGVLRLGILHRCGRFDLHGELSESFYRAHAADGSTVAVYHWFGRSLSMTAGVRCVVGGRASSGD